MPKKWKIDGLPERRAIQREMAQDVSNLRIAKKYGIAESTVREYKKTRLPQVLAEHEKARDLANAGGIIERCKDVLERMLKAADAADEWLTDPTNPNKYSLDPRGDEVMVVYYQTVKSGKKLKRIRHKARLQVLLDRISRRSNADIEEIYIRCADPRDLLLKAADRIYNGLELIARIQGQIKEIQINVTNTTAWVLIKKLTVKVLHKYPEALKEYVLGVADIVRTDDEERRNR